MRSRGDQKLYPATSMGQKYKMPDYEYIHREMQKSGVTLSLLWVEYCNQCRANGELLDTYLFVAVLPYSSYAYTEAFLDMKQDAWITTHVNAYCFFGGVTQILTPDNLQSGVIKNTKGETVVNKAYQEMAEH